MADTVNRPLNVLELLDRAPLPASKEELVQYAQDHDASEEAVEQIRAMPGENFRSIKDISNHLALMDDLPGGEANLWSSADSRDLPDERDVRLAEARGQGRV